MLTWIELQSIAPLDQQVGGGNCERKATFPSHVEEIMLFVMTSSQQGPSTLGPVLFMSFFAEIHDIETHDI